MMMLISIRNQDNDVTRKVQKEESLVVC
jgi:hypothetical protein